MASADGPRQPRNMKGLVKFCTENTASEDTTTESTLDAERIEFLTNVLADQRLNPPSVIRTCLDCLNHSCIENPEADIEDQEDALDQLKALLCDLNHSIDFVKMSGLTVMKKTLQCPHAILRFETASLLGDACQNCEFVQCEALGQNIIPILLKMVEEDQTLIRVKALYAISCLIRNCTRAVDEFLKKDGLSFLIRAIASDVEKLVLKACFLLSHLISENEKVKEKVCSLGYIGQMVKVLANPETSSICREYCTRILFDLASSESGVLEECLEPRLNLVSSFEKRLELIQEYDENNVGLKFFNDEADLIQQFLKLVESSLKKGEESSLKKSEEGSLKKGEESSLKKDEESSSLKGGD